MKPAFKIRVSCFGETHELYFPTGKDWPVALNHRGEELMSIWTLAGQPADCGCARVMHNWKAMMRTTPGRTGTFEFRAAVASVVAETSAAQPYVAERLAHIWAVATLRLNEKPTPALPPGLRMANRKAKVKSERTKRLTAVLREICRQSRVPYGGIELHELNDEPAFPGTFIGKTVLKPTVYKASLWVDVDAWARFAKKNPTLGPDKELVVRRLPLEPVSEHVLKIPYLMLDFSTARTVLRRHVLTLEDEALSETWEDAIDIGPVGKRALTKEAQ